MSASSPISQALIPMLAGYLLIMTTLGVGLRLLARSKTSGPHEGSRSASPGPADGAEGAPRGV